MNSFLSNPNTDPSDENYVLHGVLVHSGDIDGGHYFALLKPEKDGKWFRFDDDRVTPVTMREVFEDNYGDDPLRLASDPEDKSAAAAANAPTAVAVVTDDQLRCTSARALKRFTNAYMLVYIQQSRIDEILAPIKEDEIPKHLNRSLKDNAKALKDDVLNTLISSQNNSQVVQQPQQQQQGKPGSSPPKQKHIQLKKIEKAAEKKCLIM